MNRKSFGCSNSFKLTSHSMYSFLATGDAQRCNSERIIQTGNKNHIVIQL